MATIDAASVKAVLEGAYGVAVTEKRAEEIARDVRILTEGVRKAAAGLAFEVEPQGFGALLAAHARPA